MDNNRKFREARDSIELLIDTIEELEIQVRDKDREIERLQDEIEAVKEILLNRI